MRPRVRLDQYNNSWYNPGRPFLVRALWLFAGLPLFRCSLLPFSGLRVFLLRLFGATVGDGVVIHSEVVVKYPWHLQVGDHCWIGERVWMDCLTTVQLGSNVCVSQGAYLCTGNHDWTDPAFGLRVEPIQLMDESWAGAQSVLLPGSSLAQGAVLAAGSILAGNVPEYQIFNGNPARYLKERVVRNDSSANNDREMVAP